MAVKSPANAATPPALARVVKTSYLNDTLIEIEAGDTEGKLVGWPKGLDPADCGDNIIPCNDDGSEYGMPLDAKDKGKSAPNAPELIQPDPSAPARA